jgi:hypothetical protein
MMKRQWMSFVILIVTAMSLHACRTPPKLASDLKLLVISSGNTPGKSMGPIKSSDCGYRYASIGKYPSFRAALEKSNARYLNNVELKQVINYMIYSEYECKSVMAEGFK